MTNEQYMNKRWNRTLKKLKSGYSQTLMDAQAMSVLKWFEMAAAKLAQKIPPMAAMYYKNVRLLTTGFDGLRAHVQTGNTIAEVNLKGLNFAQFLAPVPQRGPA